ncbi:MAG: hypothetical protein U0R80_20550 [Nocardioidaceae bacterium]
MTRPAAPAAERVLAVDSGGSGTRVRHGGDARVVDLPGTAWATRDVPAALAATVVDAWDELGRPPTETVSLGVAATPATDDEVERLARPLADATGATEVLVANDALTGHLGALAGGWGVSLIVGTGVACVGLGPEPGEQPVVVDGHGFLLGDLGSAFWIGRRAVRAVLDAATLGADPSPLTDAVVESLGPLEGLAYRLHARTDAVAALAALAPAVADLADRDDTAADIMEQAAQHLATTAGRAAGLLDATDPVPVALGGRVLAPASPLAARVTELLGKAAPPIAVRAAEGTPLDGAARLAVLDDPPPGVLRWTRGEHR